MKRVILKSVQISILVSVVLNGFSSNWVEAVSINRNDDEGKALESNSTNVSEESANILAQNQNQNQNQNLTNPNSQQGMSNVNITEQIETITDNIEAGSNYDPSVYAGVLTPEAFQQYVQQFGAYATYPSYPAPVGYGAPPQAAVYPSPIIVQTGYEGFLVPTTTTVAPAATTPAPMSYTNIFTILSNLVSNIIMSTLFRVLAAIVSAIGVAFFGSAIVNFICSITPICDISLSAVTYLKREATPERMGRMIAEEITPDRVRRATFFVQNAIRKYKELQHSMGNN